MNLPLNPEQQKAFAKLKAAYKACEKAGIYFVNYYGSLEAYDKAMVDEYAADLDPDAEDVITADEGRSQYSFEIPVSWADDKHYIRLTRKGLKLKQDQ